MIWPLVSTQQCPPSSASSRFLSWLPDSFSAADSTLCPLQASLPFPSGVPLCLPFSWPLMASPPHILIFEVLFILQGSLQDLSQLSQTDLIFPSLTLLRLLSRSHVMFIIFCWAAQPFMCFEYFLLFFHLHPHPHLLPAVGWKFLEIKD